MSRELTPYEKRLLDIIRKINLTSGDPARTVAISVQAGNMPIRTVRWWLNRLEKVGAVQRRSPCTGYYVPGVWGELAA